MYYQELIERMWTFNQKNRLGCNAISMYLYLLKLGKENDGYYVKISDVALSNTLGITRKTVMSNKEKLKNLGLIQYENKNGFACKYRILVNYPLQKFEIENGQNEVSEENSSILKVPNSKILQSLEQFQESSEENINHEKLGHKKIIQNVKTNFPSLEDFVAYAKTLDGYEVSLNLAIESKYILWSQNGWKNLSDRPINNWKSSLKSSLPFLKDDPDKTEQSIEAIPSIRRPKSIFDD